MTYRNFKDRLNHKVFGEDLNYEILLTVLQNPKRYIGIFRITNAKTKLIQNVTHSTKKRGQYANLIKKIKALKKQYPYPNYKIIASMWFSDDSLKKNRKYYLEQIEYNTDGQVEIHIFYGKELFENIFKRIDIWNELVSHLQKHKQERSQEILNVPDFDTSNEIRIALLKVKNDYPNLVKKLLSDMPDYIELRKELFPMQQNLKELSNAESTTH